MSAELQSTGQQSLQEKREQMQFRINTLRSQEQDYKADAPLYLFGAVSLSLSIGLEFVNDTKTAVAVAALGLSALITAYLTNQDSHAAGQEAATFEAAQYIVEQTQGQPAIEPGAQAPQV